MPDPGSTPKAELSDIVTLTLHQARNKARQARILSEEQGDPVEQRQRITAALDAIEDALDVREPRT